MLSATRFDAGVVAKPWLPCELPHERPYHVSTAPQPVEVDARLGNKVTKNRVWNRTCALRRALGGVSRANRRRAAGTTLDGGTTPRALLAWRRRRRARPRSRARVRVDTQRVYPAALAIMVELAQRQC